MRNILVLIAFFSLTHVAISQDYTIVERDGEKYYSHKVEAGHTLYAIAKLYKSDEDIISEANAELKTAGLKVGQTIYIPVSPKFKPGEVKNPIRIEDGFLVHRVLKKQTLFSICREYNVDINDVLAINPEANSGLQKGMELKIPVNEVDKAVSVAPPVVFNSSKWKQHEVLAGETLYGVSRKYKVKISELLKINDGLPEGLKAGQFINIPIEISPEEVNETDSTTMKDVLRSWNKRRDNPFKETYNVALALPLFLNELDTGKLSIKESRIQRVGLSFYRGAYLAARKLEEEGFSMNLNVLNITDDRKEVKMLASDEKLHEMDLFIGPFQKQSLAKVIEIAEANDVHVVCPTPQSGKVLMSNEHVSKVIPSGSTLMGEAAKHIATSEEEANVILIATKWVRDKRNIQVFEKAYYANMADSAVISKRKLITLNAEDLTSTSLKNKLSESRKNIIVMPTEEKLALGQLVNVLPFINKSYEVELYLTDKWTDNDYIDARLRNDFKVHIPVNRSMKYGGKSYNDFDKLFYSEFKDYADDYSVLGFDVMLYYGRGLQNYGLEFPLFYDQIQTKDIIDTKFNFEETGPDSGYENHGTYIIYFEDYEMKCE